MDHLSLFTVTFLVVLFLSRLIKYLRAVDAWKSIPSSRVPFRPFAFPSSVLPTTWWNQGISYTWFWRKHMYANSEHFAVLPFMAGQPTLYTSNLDVARQVLATGNKVTFIKPLSTSGPLSLWGLNVIVAEGGEMWKRHRRIVGSAFNNQAYQLVWQTAAKTYFEMIEHEGWLKRSTVDVPDIQSYNAKFALLVVAGAAFGILFNWSTPPTAEDGSMSIQQAVNIASSNTVLCAVLPKWTWNIPIQRFRDLRAAHRVVARWLRTRISERRSDLNKSVIGENGEFNDVLSMLVQANEAEGKFKLDDDELVGNFFGMLFAGHETSSMTFTATFVYLALHQDIQDDVFQQIQDVVGDREPVFEDYYKLNKVLAVFHEANRLLPATYVSIREATEDCVLTLPNPMGQEGSVTVPIAKGSQVIVDWIGVHRNPRYFENPDEYKPSRWDKLNDEAVFGFGTGSRTCLGRRFAETEAVCLLTHLLKSWKLEPWLQNGEDLAHWRERVTNSNIKMLIVLAVGPAPLRFVSRVK